MEIASKILDKLVTDFGSLKFSNNQTIFSAVKKYYAAGRMEAMNCLIVPDTVGEEVTGISSGNSQTTRQYGFRAVMFEEIEATDSDTEGSIKYSRLLNILDSMLDYLQKEPSNLNSWGNSNNIFIFKTRVQTPIFDTQKSEAGWVVVLELPFTVYVNVVPQNL